MQDITNLIIKAMNYGYPEEIAVKADFLPLAMKNSGNQIKKIIAKYPAFFGPKWQDYDYESCVPPSYREGQFTDAWGCVWSNKIDGMESYVTGHPVKTRDDILSLKAPEQNIGFPHGFMYLRLLDLRSFEEAMIDFAEECDELQILVDKVTDYNVRQAEFVCNSNNSGPIAWVGDDLGMQTGLAIGAEKWRKYMKPAFKRIYDVFHSAGKYVYMHTDGQIFEIMPDLVECGVNMINPQHRANGIENLVRVCKGKIPICLDLDRQLFPFVSPQDMRDHARETVEKMWLPEGGLAINLEFGPEVPLENIDAILDEMNKLRFYKV